MRIFDKISMCLRNLFRRKVRTLLTVSGVVIGTCSIVVMISIGVGLAESTNAAIAQMGDLTVITIQNYRRGSSADAVKLDDKLIGEIMGYEHVVTATPIKTFNEVQLGMIGGKTEKYKMEYVNVIGVNPDVLPILGFELAEGRFLNAADDEFTIVVGQYASYNFMDTRRKNKNNRIDPYPDENGVIKAPFINLMTEKHLKFELKLDYKDDDSGKKLYFEPKVVGTLKESSSKGGDLGYLSYNGIFMNIKDMNKIETEYYKAIGKKKPADNGYQSAIVKVDDITNVKEVQDKIEALGFEAYSMESIREPMEKQARQQQLLLGGLGAISLFVAAIGITNTMVMSIYERTREIGIMKVLGCFVGNIRTVFLMEAGCIGLLGGIIGVLLSYGISFVLNYYAMGGGRGGEMGGGIMMYMGGFGGGGMGMPISVIPPWLVLLAISFAVMIGLISGFSPANRAVKISALEAIKHD